MGDWGLLGDVLREKAPDRERANVQALVTHAKNLLKLTREVFPRYTMHDEQHAENVIDLMGKLAAPRIGQMTALEAGLLILAAYFHDTGMVYAPAELKAVTGESEFRAFLDRNDDAFLATKRNGGRPPEDVVERYCRHRHADRVRVHLNRIDRSLLQWEGASLAEPLAIICRSHNENAAALHEPRFRTDFLFQADLRFCSIMLRLADILDLDDTRAPEVIYDHLGLSRRATLDEAQSDREWGKHLAARGFRFPPQPGPNYPVQFVAEPTDPGVEHDLRNFLKVVEAELVQCRSVADLCGDRWRGLELPGQIDRSTITSHGYKYGEFRFELDREAVLELFTGDNLYSDPYAFVRELLQNALDATSARTHLFGHESTGIKVTCWEDDGGYVWVRVDDDGIGMDEESLRNYFLRVGRSYYRSTEFEADLVRRGRTDQPFGVISRFGVGVLACFMVGDRLELTSRRHVTGSEPVKGVRLSINRRDDYLVLQDSDQPGRPMPSWSGPEEAFLDEPGTHIAVRINPNRTGVEVSALLNKVDAYILAPPVPVFANGEPVGAEKSQLADQLALPGVTTTDFTTDDLVWTGEIAFPYPGTVRVVAVPLDLGATAVSSDLRGQLVVYFAPPPDGAEPLDPLPVLVARDHELAEALHGSLTSTQFQIGFLRLSVTKNFRVTLRVRREYRKEDFEHADEILSSRNLPFPEFGVTFANIAEYRRHLEQDSANLAPTLKRILHESPWSWYEYSPKVSIDQLPAPDIVRKYANMGSWWSYNGVSLPIRGQHNDEVTLGTSGDMVLGVVSLSGDLKPRLSVSRAEIRAVPFEVHSALHLAFRRALRESMRDSRWLAAAEDVFGQRELLEIAPLEPFTAATLWADQLLSGGAWGSEAILETSTGMQSVEQLLAAAESGDRPRLERVWTSPWDIGLGCNFYGCLRMGLLHHFVDLEWTPATPPKKSGELRVASTRPPSHPASARLFPPLFAVRYDGDEALARSGAFLNARHPLSRWLLDNAEVLSAEYPAPFQRVFSRAGTHNVQVEDLNTALRRVGRSRPDLEPPAEAYLRKDENGRWWSR